MEQSRIIQLVGEMKKNPNTTNKQILDELRDSYGVVISERTLRRYNAAYLGSMSTEALEYETPFSGRHSDINQIKELIYDKMLYVNRRNYRIAVANDIHIPFHDKKALSIFYKILQKYKPDIVVLGGDVFDCPDISKFTPENKAVDDFFEQVESSYFELINNIKEACDAIIIFVTGNHDIRLPVWLMDKSPAFKNKILTITEEMIRYRGVLFAGWRQENIYFGDLLRITHGIRLGEFASKRTKHEPSSEGVLVTVAGHVHRPSETMVNGYYFDYGKKQETTRMRKSFVTGCLCHLDPHYGKTTNNTGWLHGFALVEMDTRNNEVFAQNLIIQNYSLVWGNEIIRS